MKYEEYKYKALLIKQTSSDKRLVLFSAPATEIDKWAGVPQKKRFGTGEETVGFQREENLKRIESLGTFCSNDENIIQNPLLCSTRHIPNIASAQFSSKADNNSITQIGNLSIKTPDYETFTMEEILGYVRNYIENRVTNLANSELDDKMLTKFKKMAAQSGYYSTYEEPAEDIDEEFHSLDNESNQSDAEAVLFEESHIVDFWQEVACRHEVIKLLETPPANEFLGFTRAALISYLRPIVLVDGQHRLKGALKAAYDCLNRPDIQSEIETLIIDGQPADAAQNKILQREVRHLPVSLLLAADPAEQVFQFVVVNQKATPIGRALLGTIVSTTLSKDEMDTVANRLKDAGIELEESQAITYLSRFEGSPFFDLVERGLAGDPKDLLQWSVFSSLVRIFRDLQGGKLFGYKNDYADIWKAKLLSSSDIVTDYDANGFQSPFDYWRKLDGPWRSVFITFFTKIRDIFGNITTPDAHNYWGKPRQSNLFNKISLTILAADFFQYLVETKKQIDSFEQIDELVEEWVEDVNRDYFNRDWNLAGVKKDSTGIRNQWAYQWEQYRKNPDILPQVRLYRNPKAN